MPDFKYQEDVDRAMESSAIEFDISKQPAQNHEWRQEGNQPILKCAIHNHTAVLPPNVHAVPDERGEMTLVTMG